MNRQSLAIILILTAYGTQEQESLYKQDSYRILFEESLKYFADQGIQSLNKESPYGILSNTIPKCGTHLFFKCLYLITGRNVACIPPFEDVFPRPLPKLLDTQVFFQAHMWPHQFVLDIFSQDSFRVFMMMRDPRDLLISRLRRIIEKGTNMTFDQLFEQVLVNPVISGHFTYFFTPEFNLTLEGRYLIYLTKWGSLPNMLVIRFEDIIGEQGGGSSEVQKQTLLKIANHLEIDLSDQDLLFIQKNLFGDEKGTFREGQIGGWKKHFTPERKALFKKYFSTEYLIELGYETSYDW